MFPCLQQGRLLIINQRVTLLSLLQYEEGGLGTKNTDPTAMYKCLPVAALQLLFAVEEEPGAACREEGLRKGLLEGVGLREAAQMIA